MDEDPTISILPFELERQIFELSALSRPVSIPTLLCVAWRVKHWIEPILYRTLVIGPHLDAIDGLPLCTVETFTEIAGTQSVSFLRDSVRNLILFVVPSKDVKFIVSTCRNVENLHIMPLADIEPGDDTLASINMPLRHLYCDFDDLCSVVLFESFSLPPFSRLTHLELFHGLTNNTDFIAWSDVAELAHLSHLSFDIHTLVTVFEYLLTTCKSLRALVILCPPPRTAVELQTLAKDPRFVMMVVEDYTGDWQRGILTGDDYWSRADAFIAQRISGEIDRHNFFLEQDQ
ncbi:hypothetical protein FB451DRAFT_1228123 [Mycena latifolia]|nr:hypothetical protein FB451DRAFT_1228123 [Mycena latifolia]